MNAQDLKKVLENTSNKMDIFSNRETLLQYDITVSELNDLIDTFLSDTEKVQILNMPHFKSKDSIIIHIVKSINNPKIKLQLMKDKEIASKFSSFEIIQLVKTFDKQSIKELLYMSEFLKEHNLIGSFYLNDIFKMLNDDEKQEILENEDYVKTKLCNNQSQIAELLKLIKSEETKTKMMELYQIDNYLKVDILKTFSDKAKQKVLKENPYELNREGLEKIAATLHVDELVKFFEQNQDYLQERGIRPYNIIMELEPNKQLSFIKQIEQTKLNLDEKRKIYATLSKQVKRKLSAKNLPEEYKTALDMNLKQNTGALTFDWKVEFNPNIDLEKYKGLDELIYVNPTKMDDFGRSKLAKLCEICPDINISDNIDLAPSTAKEFIEAEQWISSVLEGINEEWSDIQKIAYIDNRIGKKISYSPDFETEVFDFQNARALWRIVTSEKGVCNGIAQIENYILARAGIESEMVSSGGHSFLKLKNITIPTKEGEKEGDTLIDPTWNLAPQRFGARPQCFCLSYEELRKNDILSNGTDRESHKNEKLKNITLSLDDEYLREVYKSIGLTNEDGTFPIKTLVESLTQCKSSGQKGIQERLEIFSAYYPEFANCNDSSTVMLKSAVLNPEIIDFERCIVKRVYSRNDEEKEPILYVYANCKEEGKMFYVADKEEKQFIPMNEEEFEKDYECYEEDIEREGKRPWEEEIKNVNKLIEER